MTTSSLRWLAPVAVCGLVAAAVTVPRLADASDAAAELPPRTAAELLTAVSAADVDGMSGTVVSTSRLGLPELPGADSGGAVSLPGLLAGSTTARVWKAGEEQVRLAVDAPFAEYDVVADGRDVWTFDSASSDVTHLVLPERTGEPAPEAPETSVLPQEVAESLVAAVEPSTEVSVGRAAMVADRAAYELVLDPRDPGTLVDTVRIAVDGETSVPLRVQVFGAGQAEPAVEIGFTSVRFEVPDASVFAFVPPPGSEVTERRIEDGAWPSKEGPEDGPDGPDASEAPTGSAPTVLGEGWTSVVELSGVELPEQAAGLVDQIATPVEGGRVVQSALVTVLLLDDGRALAGSVPAERLLELADR